VLQLSARFSGRVFQRMVELSSCEGTLEKAMRINRPVGSMFYFFNPACQLSTTVIGTVADCSTGVAIKKRPSALTS
jgi:hypothetical protein